MKFFSTEFTFEHPWDYVTCANWKKYPNEITTHVIAVDVLKRDVNPTTGVLRTERLITCQQAIPRWLSAVLPMQNVSYVREVSEVDPKNRTLVMRSQNLTAASTLSVYETVTYRPDPKDVNRTLFTQEATFRAFLGWRKLCNKVEDWSVERFQQNAGLGKEAFESVLSRLMSEKVPQQG